MFGILIQENADTMKLSESHGNRPVRCLRKWGSLRVHYIVLLMLVVFTMFIRVVADNPISAPDTHGYIFLAETIEHGTFREYNFARTPGLPMLMILAGHNYKTMITVQYVIALVSIISLYRLIYPAVERSCISLICTSIYFFNLNIWSLASSILTDSLATSLALIAISFMYISVINENSAKYVIVSSIIISFSILVRPILATIMIAYIIVYLVKKPTRRYYFALFSPLVIVLPWVYILWESTGEIGLTTLMPKNITNHTGAFLEYADDEYSSMRDPYIEERNSRGTHVMTIFGAQNAMRANYPDLTDTEYNDELMRMSLSAIRNKPFLYIKSVFVTIAKNHIPCNPSDEFLAQLGDGFLLRLWARRGSKILLILFEFLTYLYFVIKCVRKKMTATDWLFAVILLCYIIPVSMLESPSGRYMMPIVIVYYIYGCKFVQEYVFN